MFLGRAPSNLSGNISRICPAQRVSYDRNYRNNIYANVVTYKDWFARKSCFFNDLKSIILQALIV